MPQLPLPRHLAHQPIFALPFFDHDPGNEGDTDCQFLSIGWSQWDQHQLSAKILRHSDRRWSRQSEEIPPARLIDLTIFLLLCIKNNKKSSIEVPAQFFENQVSDVSIDRLEQAPSKRDAFSKTLLDNDTLLRRINKLASIIDELRSVEYIEQTDGSKF